MRLNFGGPGRLIMWVDLLFGLDLGDPDELMCKERRPLGILKQKLHDDFAGLEGQSLVDLRQVEQQLLAPEAVQDFGDVQLQVRDVVVVVRQVFQQLLDVRHLPVVDLLQPSDLGFCVLDVQREELWEVVARVFGEAGPD